MLEHGGRLRRAALGSGIDLADWLDLSTGVAPYHPLLPALDARLWQRLPEDDDQLEAAARDYYQVAELLPVAGSQAALQALPRLWRNAEVAIIEPTYAEHAAAWQREGHRLWQVSEGAVHRLLDRLDVLLLVNPNNPTGRRVELPRLLEWQARLAARGGCLIVDEAFIDCTPQHSLAAFSPRSGLIVLRSFGKFFGLAGARLGFVLAERAVLQRLAELLGPWAISGPSRALAAALLQDQAGIEHQRRRLLADSERLARLLGAHGLPPSGGCGLFHWCLSAEAEAWQRHLAGCGILVRRFAEHNSLRFGLPGDEVAWQRLQLALEEYLP